jgi:hypothetical protein
MHSIGQRRWPAAVGRVRATAALAASLPFQTRQAGVRAGVAVIQRRQLLIRWSMNIPTRQAAKKKVDERIAIGANQYLHAGVDQFTAMRWTVRALKDYP